MTEQEESYLLQSYNENESLFGNINSSFQWNPHQARDRIMMSRKHEFTSIYNQLNSDESVRSSRNKQYKKTPKLGTNELNKENTRQVIQLDVKMLDSIWEQIAENETTAYKYTKRENGKSKMKRREDDCLVEKKDNNKSIQRHPSLQLINKNVKNSGGRVKSEAANYASEKDIYQILESQQKYLGQRGQQRRNFTSILPILDEFFHKYQILNQQISSYEKVLQNMQFIIKEQQKYIDGLDSYFSCLAKKLQVLSQSEPISMNYHLHHFRSNLNLMTSQISAIFHKCKPFLPRIGQSQNKLENICNTSVDWLESNYNQKQKGHFYETQPTERLMNKETSQINKKINEKQSVINIIDAQTPEMADKEKINKYSHRQVTQFCDYAEQHKERGSYLHLKSCIQYCGPEPDTSTYRKLTNLRIQQMQSEIKLLQNSLHNANIKMMVLKNENKELRQILEGLISEISKSKKQKFCSFRSLQNC